MEFKLITVDRYKAANSEIRHIAGDNAEHAWELYWKERLRTEDGLEGKELNDAWEQICETFRRAQDSLKLGKHGLWGADGEEYSWVIVPL